MKNIFANAMLVAVVVATMFPVSVFATTDSEALGGSVYASKAEQETISEAIQKDLMFYLNRYDITLVSESISPLYGASIYEYAETGVFAVRPGVLHGNEYYYNAKTVNAEGLFAGNLSFYIEDGVAHFSNFTPTVVLKEYYDDGLGSWRDGYPVSRSYADHAQRIQNLTGKKSFVPVSEVRLVTVEGLGMVFYINDGKKEALVNIETVGDYFYKDNKGIIYIGRELKEIADGRLAEREAQRKRWAEEKAAWEAANPGKRWAATGGSGDMVVFAMTDNVDDIVNIEEYLGAAAIIDATTGTPPSTTNNLAWLWLLALPLAALAVFVGVRLIRKGKEAGNADSQSDDN